ncbi:MAG: hypothetical protein EBY20_01805, partial [Alphaproteobacteria bacterium]|nr:hypothetical protein [Alphaproteobacteria bacterium]
MSFRQFGGLNYSARNNIITNQYSNSAHVGVTDTLGQPNSKIVSQSHIDMSANSVMHIGRLYFMDGTVQSTAASNATIATTFPAGIIVSGGNISITSTSPGDINFNSNGSINNVNSITSNGRISAPTFSGNLVGGAKGSLVYQSDANSTAFLGIGTSGQVLTVNSGTPTWTSLTLNKLTTESTESIKNTPSSSQILYPVMANGVGEYKTPHIDSTSSTNFSYDVSTTTLNVGGAVIANSYCGKGGVGTIPQFSGGSAGSIPYQSDENKTNYLTAPENDGSVLVYNKTGKTPMWVAAGSATFKVSDVSSDSATYYLLMSTDIGEGKYPFIDKINSPFSYTPSSGTLNIPSSITCSSTTFNLLNAAATTINFGGDATALTIGAAGGTLTINNPTIATIQTSVDLLNTNATTINFGGAAASLTVGAISGTFTINNPIIATTQTSVELLNTNAATIKFGGTATALTIGSIAGTLTINNPNIVTSQTTTVVNLLNTNATTINFAGAATALTVGATTAGGTLTINNPNIVTSQTTTPVNLLNTNATTINFGGAATALTVGASTTGGTLTINNPNIVTSQTTTPVNLLNTNATTINFGGAATSLTVGTSTGTLTINNPTIATSQTTTPVNLLNTNATTINFGGAATALTVGAETGTLTIRNPTIIPTKTSVDLFNTVATTINFAGAATALTVGAETGTLTINNPTIATSQTTTPINLFNTNATTINFGGAATSLTVGTSTGTLTINNPNIVTSQTTTPVNLLNTNATTINFGGAATSLTVGAETGTLTIRNPTIIPTKTSVDLFNTVAATINFGGAATALSVGASTGTLTINNPNIVTSQTTTPINLFNTNATTINFGGAATSLTVGASTGTLTINNPTIATSQTLVNLLNTNATTINFGGAATAISIGSNSTSGQVTINSTKSGTSAISAALAVSGGIGIGGSSYFANTKEASTSSTSGALVVAGGIGVGGISYFANTIKAFLYSGLTQTANTVTIPQFAGGAAGSIPYQSGESSTTFLGIGTANYVLTVNSAGRSPEWVIPTIAPFDVNTLTLSSDPILYPVMSLDTGFKQTPYIDKTTTPFSYAPLSGTLTVPSAISCNSTTFDLLNATATTINFGGAATALTVGASTGTLTIRNPTIIPTKTSVDLFNTVATTINFGGAATVISIGPNSNTGQATINSTKAGTSATSAALVVAGGIGVAGESYFGSTIRASRYCGSNASTAIPQFAGGAKGSIPYQTDANSTDFLSLGTSGNILTVGSTGLPTWSAPS